MTIQFPVSGIATRLIFTCSIHLLLWLALARLAVESTQGLYWLRGATCVGALLPFHFWLVQEAMADDLAELRTSARWRAALGLVLAADFGVLPLTDFFIPSQTPPAGQTFGIGYPLYVLGVVGMYLGLGLTGLRRLRTLGGSRRLALQVWLGAGSVAGVLIVGSMLLRVALRDGGWVRAQPVVVLACYAWVALALTTRRTFEPRRLLLIGIEKALLVATLAAAVWLSYHLLRYVIPPGAALASATILGWGLALILRGSWDRAVQLLAETTRPPSSAA